jgi:hypothetical protein
LRYVRLYGNFLPGKGDSFSLLLRRKPIKDVIDTYDNPNAFGIFRSNIGKVIAFYVTTISSCPKLNHHMPGRKEDFVTTATTNETTAATAQNNTTTDLPSTTAPTPTPPPAEEAPPPAEEAEQHEQVPRKKPGRWMYNPVEQEPEQPGRFSDGQFPKTRVLVL